MNTKSNIAPLTSKHLILACDGGGIRGLITALLLQQLVKGHPTFLKNTHLFAGTSTGGIISLALAAGLHPKQLVTLYGTDGGKIFKKSGCASSMLSTEITQVASSAASASAADSWFGTLFHFKDELICTWYTSIHLRKLLEAKLGSLAKATLSQLKQFVLVNTMQLCDSKNLWKQLQLTNLPGIKGNDSTKTLVIDAAMSTSAAPIYFPPHKHPTYGYCADGGLFANNPGTIAITTLMESGVPLDEIWMLSLSTGNTQDCYPPSVIKKDAKTQTLGPLFWLWPEPQTNGAAYTPALPLMSALFDGTSEIDTYQCRQLLGERFRRANVPLTQPIALDDHSKAAIKTMTESTKSYMGTSVWTEIESWIEHNFA